jgi:hypothetical protein
MPSWTVNITAVGWFDVTADDKDEARKVAEDLSRGGVPIGAQFDYCDIESIEPESDE